MKIQLIRNATMRIEYAGRTILTDPCLAPAGTLPAYAGIAQNPTVSLPIAVDELLTDIDLVLISHLHNDHFDPTARQLIPPDMPLVCRRQDADPLKKDFNQIRALEEQLVVDDIEFHCVPARHGTSEGVLADMGTPCGYIIKADNEPTLYWAGDTVWYKGVENTIDRWQPDVILTHSGGAVWNKDELIVMDAEQTVAVCRQAPASTVVAIHMEAFDHCLSTRSDLRQLARSEGIADDRLFIPADGEELIFD